MLSYSFGPQLERPPIGRTFPSRLWAPKVDPSRLVSSTRLLFSSKFSHKLPRASGAWRHPHLVTQYCLGLLWHLSDTSIRPRAPALTEIPRLFYNISPSIPIILFVSPRHWIQGWYRAAEVRFFRLANTQVSMLTFSIVG